MFVLLIGSLFLLMYLSVRLPFGVALDGSPIKQISLTFRERLLFRRSKLVLFGSNFASQCCRSVVSN